MSSWGSFFKTSSAIVDKNFGDHPVAKKIPFNAKIGSMLNIQDVNVFLRSSFAGGLVIAPKEHENTVVALGRIGLGDVGDLYKIYLTKRDSPVVKFIQVFQDHTGAMKDVQYFSLLSSVIPTTSEDFDLLTGANGDGLGDISYCLDKEFVLSSNTVDASVVETAFAGKGDGIDFIRNAGGDNQYFSPFVCDETYIGNREGTQGCEMQTYFMPYVRQFSNGGNEYLMVATHELSSKDSNTSYQEVSTHYSIGIDVDSNSIQVL